MRWQLEDIELEYLDSSFVAEVKSDLMGEQTILCGLLQTGSILCFDKMVANGIEEAYASKLIQYGLGNYYGSFKTWWNYQYDGSLIQSCQIKSVFTFRRAKRDHETFVSKTYG